LKISSVIDLHAGSRTTLMTTRVVTSTTREFRLGYRQRQHHAWDGIVVLTSTLPFPPRLASSLALPFVWNNSTQHNRNESHSRLRPRRDAPTKFPFDRSTSSQIIWKKLIIRRRLTEPAASFFQKHGRAHPVSPIFATSISKK
jgi:hypothetical protein